MRARIGAQVHELDAAPGLALYKKHDIEAAVDRFRVRPDLPCAWPNRSRPPAPARHLTQLRDLGNAVIVVERDEEAIWAADHVVDMRVAEATMIECAPPDHRPTPPAHILLGS